MISACGVVPLGSILDGVSAMRQLIFLGTRCLEVRFSADLDGARSIAAGARRISPEDLARWATSGVDQLTLRRLLHRVDSGSRPARLDDAEVIRRLGELLVTGAITMRALATEPLPARDGEAESAPAPREETRSPKTWIEVRLIGDDDLPIPGARCLLELPDGSEMEGYLDARGLWRVDDLDPGLCKVHFPDLDQDAWAPR